MAADGQDDLDLEAGTIQVEAPVPVGTADIEVKDDDFQVMMLDIASWLDEHLVTKLKQARTSLEVINISKSYDALLVQNMDWTFVNAYCSGLDIGPFLLWSHLRLTQFPSIRPWLENVLEVPYISPLPPIDPTFLFRTMEQKRENGLRSLEHDSTGAHWWHIHGYLGQGAVMQFVPIGDNHANLHGEDDFQKHTIVTFYFRRPPNQGNEVQQQTISLKLRKGEDVSLAENNLLVFINAPRLPKLNITSRLISSARRLWQLCLLATDAQLRRLLRVLTSRSTLTGFYYLPSAASRRIDIEVILSCLLKAASGRQEQSHQGEPMLAFPVGRVRFGLNDFMRSWLSDGKNMNLLRSIEKTSEVQPGISIKGCCLVMNLHIWRMTLEVLGQEVRYLAQAAVREPNFDAFTRLNAARDQGARLQEQILRDIANAESNELALSWALAHMQDQTGDSPEHTSTGVTQEARVRETQAFSPRDEIQANVNTIEGTKGQLENDVALTAWKNEYTTLRKQLDDMVPKLEKTFKLLISAITVLDSAEARKQGKRTTLLTIVAAVYLPMTLAVGVFGMNVKGVDDVEWWWPVALAAILGVPSIVVILVALLR